MLQNRDDFFTILAKLSKIGSFSPKKARRKGARQRKIGSPEMPGARGGGAGRALRKIIHNFCKILPFPAAVHRI